MVDRTIEMNKLMEKLRDYNGIEWVQINCAHVICVMFKR